VESERKRRRIVGAVVGTEVGAASGLLLLGGVRFAPLLTTLVGAFAGAFAAKPALGLRERLLRRALRRHLRTAGQSKPEPAR
jgi:uncharacterized membrane protein